MRRLLAILALTVSTVFVASAQVAEITVTGAWSAFTDGSIGTSSGFAEDPQEFDLDNGVRIGARLSLNRWFLGHEFSYAFQRSTLNLGGQEFGGNGGMTIQNYYYNFVVHGTPQGTRVRPFATAGIGFSTFFPPGASSFSGAGDSKFGFNFGTGVKAKLSDRFGIRFDVRDHVTGKPFNLNNNSGRLHNVEYSAGFSLLF